MSTTFTHTPESSHATSSQIRETDVVIVGGGHNGLTAGCFLAREGLDVLLVEAHHTIGGMTATTATLPTAPEHKFNEGAIQLTGIFRLSEIAAELNLPAFGLQEIPVDPAHLQLGADGSSLGIWKDRNRTIRELERYSKKDAARGARSPRRSTRSCRRSSRTCRSHPTRALSWEMVKALAGTARRPGRLAPVMHFMTASHTEILDELFESELPKGALAAMAAFQRMEADMTAAVALIYLGVVQRVSNSMPVGGTFGLPKALAACFEHHGGHIRTSARVEEIIVQGSRATGVRLAGRRRDPRPPGCDDDLQREARAARDAARGRAARAPRHAGQGHPRHEDAGDLAEDQRRPEGPSLDAGALRPARRRPRPGGGADRVAHARGAVAGLERRLSAATGPTPFRSSCAIFPTHVDPTMAPEGQDTFWLWSGVIPVHPRVPWDNVRDEIGQKVLADAAQYFEGLDTLEIDRAVLGGPDIEERFNAPLGQRLPRRPAAHALRAAEAGARAGRVQDPDRRALPSPAPAPPDRRRLRAPGQARRADAAARSHDADLTPALACRSPDLRSRIGATRDVDRQRATPHPPRRRAGPHSSPTSSSRARSRSSAPGCGPAFATLLFGGWGLMAGYIPLISPADSAAQVAGAGVTTRP